MDRRMKRVVKELRRVVADAEGLLEAGGEQLGEARGAFGERLAQARDRLTDIEQELVRSCRRTAREVDRYAHEHPWQLATIGVAAALAIALVAQLVVESHRDRPSAAWSTARGARPLSLTEIRRNPNSVVSLLTPYSDAVEEQNSITLLPVWSCVLSGRLTPFT